MSGKFSGNGPFRFHKIDEAHDTEIRNAMKNEIDQSVPFYQVRFGSSFGGIHGIIIDNIFYIVWFDPKHYLYFDAKYGPKVPHKIGECVYYKKQEYYDSLEDRYMKKCLEFDDLFKMVEGLTDPAKRK